MDLPEKGEIVPLEKIKEICNSYGLDHRISPAPEITGREKCIEARASWPGP